MVQCPTTRRTGRSLRCRTSGISRIWGVVLLIPVLLGTGCVTTVSDDARDEALLSAAIRDVGIDHLSQGRTAMAIRKLQEARSKDPADPITFLWLGEAYRRKGMLSEAEQHLLHSLELNPLASDYNHQETVLNLGALYIQMKRYDESIPYFQELVDDPTFSTPWRALTNRGWAEYMLRRYIEARQSWDEALDFFPRYSPAHLNLGILDQKEHQYLSAIQHFEEAIESQRLGRDGDAEANYRMAEVYVAIGRRQKAIEHFTVALEQSPYGDWGSQSKSYLDLLR
jgi:tetratricopeptide (TPR) repeat protein